MFTVKHIDSRGRETVYAATGMVEYDGAELKFGAKALDGEWDVELDNGRAYVMNAAGKTVADYRLGAAENRPLGDPRVWQDNAAEAHRLWMEAEKRQREATVAQFARAVRGDHSANKVVDRPARDERFSDDVKRARDRESDALQAAIARQEARAAERRREREEKRAAARAELGQDEDPTT